MSAISTPFRIPIASPTPESQGITASPEILVIHPTVVKRPYSLDTAREIDGILSKLESGQSVSSSPEHSALAIEAASAARGRKASNGKWAKNLAKDLAEGID